MEENKKHGEELNRRQFFKKAAKGLLPVIGAIALSQIPILGNAANHEGQKETGCYYGCDGGCSVSCSSSCQGYCSGGCRGTCTGGSTASCGGCRGACASSCSGTCSSGCRGYY